MLNKKVEAKQNLVIVKTQRKFIKYATAQSHQKPSFIYKLELGLRVELAEKKNHKTRGSSMTLRGATKISKASSQSSNEKMLA